MVIAFVCTTAYLCADVVVDKYSCKKGGRTYTVSSLFLWVDLDGLL